MSSSRIVVKGSPLLLLRTGVFAERSRCSPASSSNDHRLAHAQETAEYSVLCLLSFPAASPTCGKRRCGHCNGSKQ